MVWDSRLPSTELQNLSEVPRQSLQMPLCEVANASQVRTSPVTILMKLARSLAISSIHLDE